MVLRNVILAQNAVKQNFVAIYRYVCFINVQFIAAFCATVQT